MGVREDDGRSANFPKASSQSTREGRKTLLKVSSYEAGGNGPSSGEEGLYFLEKLIGKNMCDCEGHKVRSSQVEMKRPVEFTN